MPSDGRFRVIVFGGDVSRPGQLALVNELGGWLSTVLLPRCPRRGAESRLEPSRLWLHQVWDGAQSLHRRRAARALSAA